MNGRRSASLFVVVGLLLGLTARAGAQTGPCGAHPWCNTSLSPDARAALLVDALTLDEKFQLMGGDDPTGVFTGEPANGTSIGIARLGVPTVFFNDGPAGVRKGMSTGLPAPVALAATWDPSVAASVGALIGNEARNKGIHVVHAPAVNIVRVLQGGRSFEYYGEDPHLAARLAVAFVDALQREGVVGNVKHYAVNNQETDRFFTNAIVDERTLREIYLPAFEATVREADVGSVMLSYNRVNGTHVTEHPELVNGILKGDFGLRGFTLTDYGVAQRSTAPSANAGNDLELPQAFWFSPTNLSLAVSTGQIHPSVIDESVHRILRTMFRFGIFDEPPRPSDGAIAVAAHAAVARRVEEEGIVVLKNHSATLPLAATTIRSIAVIGPEADSYRNGGGSSNVTPPYFVTPLAGIRARVGSGVEVRYDQGFVAAQAAEVARGADAAIVVVNDNQTEFVDKPCLTLACGDPSNGDQDGLIEAVAAANPRTIVLLETGSPVLMPWVDRVPAIVQAWYPGQEGGTAIARVLFGDVDPGGRLPVTFPRREEDTPVGGHPERYPGIALNAEYSEGVFVGYRHYDEHGIAPLFAFGHGLSYTTFEYGRPRIRRDRRVPGRVTVKLRVRNVGTRAGSEVVQLYVGLPDGTVPQPPKQLKAFQKIRLEPRRAAKVAFTLEPRAFAYWHEARDEWVVDPGCYTILAGSSSRDIRATGVVALGGADCRR